MYGAVDPVGRLERSGAAPQKHENDPGTGIIGKYLPIWNFVGYSCRPRKATNSSQPYRGAAKF